RVLFRSKEDARTGCVSAALQFEIKGVNTGSGNSARAANSDNIKILTVGVQKHWSKLPARCATTRVERPTRKLAHGSQFGAGCQRAAGRIETGARAKIVADHVSITIRRGKLELGAGIQSQRIAAGS